MKFALDDRPNGYLIDGHQKGKILINGFIYSHSLILAPDILIENWKPNTADELDEDCFEQILALKPEIVLLGTGEKQHFPHPKLYKSLINQHIGVEIMNTPAACRTYNVLLAEDRRVIAALIT